MKWLSVSALGFVCALLEVEASANSVLSVCNMDSKRVEETRENRTQQARDIRDRADAQITWFEKASDSEISNIWGEPELIGRFPHWQIPMENSLEVSEEIFVKDDLFCFYQYGGPRVLYVGTQLSASPKNKRFIKVFVTTGPRIHESRLQ